MQSIPTKYLISPSGKCAMSNAHVGAAQIEEQLKDASVYPHLDYSKKFDAAIKALKSNDMKKATDEVLKLEKDTGKDGENAKALHEWIDAEGGKKLAAADALKEAGDLYEARDAYTEIEKRWHKDAEYTKAAKTKLDELKKDKDAKKVFGVEKTYQDAVTCEKLGDKKKAAANYMKCAKATAGTKFAEKCEAKAKSLG